MKTDYNEPAFPFNYGDHTIRKGLTKREHFAAIASDDFDKFSISLQIEIIGCEPPNYTTGNETRAIYNLEYTKWLAKGRAIWKVMQADELIRALNKEE